MPERRDTSTGAPDGPRAPLFDAGEIRVAFTAMVVGMAAVLVVILLLASSRPQGDLQPADDAQFRSLLNEAAENLDGYELVGEERARIDIDHAIELVAQRGVDLPLTALDAPLQAQAPAEAEADASAGGDAEPADDGAAGADGAAVYAANCASCHQPNGQGIPGAFPPLANGHMPALLAAEGGREYLVHVLLYGLQGSIDVLGRTYAGVMPAWPQLSDAEIAAVLNHERTAWDDDGEFAGGFEPFTADEIAAARGQELGPADVLEMRPALD